MQNENKLVDKHILELHRSRQRQLMQGFMIYFLMSAISMVFISFIRENDSLKLKILQLLISLSTVSLFALFMYLIYKHSKSYQFFDNYVLVMTIFYASFAMLFSNDNLILGNIMYFPVFLFFVFSTLSSIRLTIYLVFYCAIVIYNYLMQPNFQFHMNQVNYLLLIISALTVFIIAIRLIILYNNYIKSLSLDFIDLHEKNMELNALNEEYYATQEELYEKYDEVTHLNEKNEKLAFFDSLTGLPNRNGFLNTLKKLLENNQQNMIVVYTDILRFKDINSVYTYQVGDELLCEIAKRIDALPLSVLCRARISSDLFALLIQGEYSETQLLKALYLLCNEYESDQFYINLKMNFGIFRVDEKSDLIEDILRSADAALNKAKEINYQNYYVFDHVLIEETEKRVMMTRALEYAIHNEKIKTVFQPIFDSESKKITSYETLARWTDDTLGIINPMEFIELAEKNGLILPLGEKILYQACAFIKQLQKQDDTAIVTVNISGVQLRHENFYKSLLDIVDTYDIDYGKIGLEVTETDLIHDFVIAHKQLTILREKGFKIYLDDFGTGYSSLNYLGRLPVDILKIDRSFITDIHIRTENQPMLQAIIRLAHDYHLKTVAEGVEVEEEYQYTKELGIQMIQGYYFSKPLPPDEILSKHL